MKTKLILTGWLMVSGLNWTHADVTMVQKMDYVSGLPAEAAKMAPQQITLRVKGDKLRTDTPPMGYSVMDTASGDSFTVLDAQKSYVKMPGKAVAEEAKKKLSEMDLEAVKPVATGQMERVGDYDTEIYTVNMPQMKMKLWVAKDYPNHAQINAEMKKMSEGSFMSAMRGGMKVPAASEVPGLAVKSEIEISQPIPMVMRMTLISVSQDPISDEVFTIPAGYTPMEVPAMVR